MPVPSKMADLSTIASSNSPAGSEAIGNSLDDYLRAGFTILRSTNAVASSTLASASTVDLGTADAEYVQITGTATISSFGTIAAGIVRECQFAGALTITASANILTPGSANIAVAAGDVLRFRSMGAGVWRYVGASTAARLATPRAFNLTGLVTAGAVNFDGSGNVTLATTIADAALSIAKTSGLQAALDARLLLSGGNLSGAVKFAAGQGNGVQFARGAGVGAEVWKDAATDQWNFDQQNSADIIFRTAGTAERLRISYTGTVTVTGSLVSTGGFQTSDRRAKRNIHPREVQRGLALRLARMFCEWNRIADGVHDVGLVAQRVKAIAARYVIRGPKQGRKAGMLAIDKAGIALEASMDCALQLDEQAKTIRALLRRTEKLEKAR